MVEPEFGNVGLHPEHGGSGLSAIITVGVTKLANNSAAANHIAIFFTVVKVLSKVDYTVIMCCRKPLCPQHGSNFRVPKV